MYLVLLIRMVRRARAHKAFGIFVVGLLLTIAVMGNAVCFYAFDGATDPAITFGDALWYSVVSITTIGYGDLSASSVGARIGTAVFIMVIGLTAFSIFFGLLVDWFAEMAFRGERGMADIHATGHTIIVHFPSEARVDQLITEIQSDRNRDGSREVVIVSDRIERLPFRRPEVFFVRGSTLSASTYERAKVQDATKVIVLATSYNSLDTDAVVASAASVINAIKPELHIVAECMNDEHRKLFDAANCDAIVAGLRITGNLLVQEAQDPGISQTFDLITSNLGGDTLYSTELPAAEVESSYGDLVKRLMDRNLNVLAVVRGRETFTRFADLAPEVGDRIVYLADHRWTTAEIRA